MFLAVEQLSYLRGVECPFVGVGFVGLISILCQCQTLCLGLYFKQFTHGEFRLQSVEQCLDDLAAGAS